MTDNTHINVLSIDIGVRFFSCVAVSFHASEDGVCKCTPVIVNIAKNKHTIRSIDIIDAFNVNLGERQGIKTLDALIATWSNFAVFQFFQPDIILIENQVRCATLNMALSFATYTLAKQQFPLSQVRFVPAKHKFKGYLKFFPDIGRPQSLQTYKDRKKEAVRISNEILNQYFHVASIDQLGRSEASDERVRKMDDISDSFLQVFCVTRL